MTKIIIMSDVHGNLPALEAALAIIKREGYDLIFHVGDSIGIGPYPAETLDALLSTRNIRFVMDNHEDYFVNGIRDPKAEGMSDTEVLHHEWVHQQLGDRMRPTVAQWPSILSEELEGNSATFIHYGMTAEGTYLPIVKDPSPMDLDRTFSSYKTDLVFYGHTHIDRADQGRARYVSAGSLGCGHSAIARYCVAKFSKDGVAIEQRKIPYDRTELFQEFKLRKVPDREFIERIFFGKTIGDNS